MIIPTFNAASHLLETIEHVLQQSVPPLEIIVVDDCSIDDTQQLMKGFCGRSPLVRYLRTPANSGGPATPRNLGMEAATGQWIALCDSDDLWHPKKLERQLDAARRRNVAFVCSAIQDFDDSTGRPAFKDPTRPSADVDLLPLTRMLKKNLVATSSVLIRREDALAVGGFDASRLLVAVEDYDLWLRWLESGRAIARTPEPLVHYRRSSGSLSSSKLRMAAKVCRVLSRHYRRMGRTWMFPAVAPGLMAAYAWHSFMMRIWRRQL